MLMKNKTFVGNYFNEKGEVVSYVCKYHAEIPVTEIPVTEKILCSTNLKRISDDLWESNLLQVKKYGDVFHLRYRLYNTGSVFMGNLTGLHQLQQVYAMFEGKKLEVTLG